MIDPSEVAQRYLTFKPMPPGNYTIVIGEEPAWFKLANEIRSYGEQCRRAGAEAAAIKLEDFMPDEVVPSQLELMQKAIRALPSAAEAASPAPRRTDYGPIMDEAVRDPEGMELIMSTLRPEAASPAAGWRPIETAPKDGRVFLGAMGEVIALTGWKESPAMGFWACSYPDDLEGCGPYIGIMVRGWRPTMWKPLPEPPSPSEEARVG